MSRRLSLRAITLWAPAEVATSTIEGSMAPSTGQAKSVLGFGVQDRLDGRGGHARWRGSDWTARRARLLPWWAREARSGSAKGSATTSSPFTASWRSMQPLLGDAWFLPGTVRSPFSLYVVALGHRVDGGEQVGVDDPGDRQVLAERDELLEPAAGCELLGEVVVAEDGRLLLVGVCLAR